MCCERSIFMAKDQSQIFRIKVPPEDPIVRQWCLNQHHNLSLAIRCLIQDEVKKHGVGNYFATDNGKLGVTSAKPKKAVKKVEPVPKPEPEPQSYTPQPSYLANPAQQVPAQDNVQPNAQPPVQPTVPPTQKTASDDDLNNFMM